MEEYNFFGNKGKLRDVSEVIEEQVQQRIAQEKEKEKREKEISAYSKSIEDLKTSKSTTDAQLTERSKLLSDLFKDYKNLAKEHEGVLSELNEWRQKQKEKEERMAAFREKMQHIRNQKVHQIENNQNVPKADKQPPDK